jgi:hypothetical protein
LQAPLSRPGRQHAEAQCPIDEHHAEDDKRDEGQVNAALGADLGGDRHDARVGASVTNSQAPRNPSRGFPNERDIEMSPSATTVTRYGSAPIVSSSGQP